MNELKEKKERLIRELQDRGLLKDKRILDAFRKVPREEFVLAEHRGYSYVNEPLPILKGQTISQPLTVAAMTEALDLKEGQKILEVGTGSGYQAAILSELTGKSGRVITIERIHELAEFAAGNLHRTGYSNVTVIEGDGSTGYENQAPYDRIMVTASAVRIPPKLIEQLKEGGKMVIPVGKEMYLIGKKKGKIEKAMLGYYMFVPLVED